VKVALLALSPRVDGGQYQYTATLIETFCDLAKQGALEVSVVHRSDYDGVPSGPGCASVSVSGLLARAEALFATYLGTGVAACASDRFDVAVSPKTCLAARKSGRRCVVTVHDLQHRRLPDFFSRRRRMLRDWLYRRAALTADRIVCETEHVKGDIVECYGVMPDSIDVVPCPPPSYVLKAATDERHVATVREKYNLPSDYLFYPAQFWRHKNHLLLVESLWLLKATFGMAVPLVLVGSPQENFTATMRRVRDLRLGDQVLYLGYVPDADMPCLFKAAAALVVPSLFESLSIPVWEAFHLGVPVVCANASAFPEQVGAAALLFDPHSPSDCAQKLYECLSNGAMAQTLVANGRERIRELTLKRYTEQWRGVLARAADS